MASPKRAWPPPIGTPTGRPRPPSRPPSPGQSVRRPFRRGSFLGQGRSAATTSAGSRLKRRPSSRTGTAREAGCSAQRERQEAHERREQTRARRSARRQAVIHAVRDGSPALSSPCAWASSDRWRTVIGGLNAIDATAGEWTPLDRPSSCATRRYIRSRRSSTPRCRRQARSATPFSSLLSRLAVVPRAPGPRFTGPHPRSSNAAARGYGLVAASTQKVSDTIGPRAQESFRWLSGRAGTLSRASARRSPRSCRRLQRERARLRRRSRGGWRPPERLPARICGAPPTAPGRCWRARRPLRRRPKTRYPCRTG